MPATVHHQSMGRKTVVTTDKYGRETVYNFRPNRDGIGVVPQDGYTPPVLKALWDESIPVDWSPDDLTPTQRTQLKGFCDDCGTKIQSTQIGPEEFEYHCPNCSLYSDNTGTMESDK